ncbi:MAG: helix-turn-helix transcriptional regulator [Ktedonobacteraceae bacterium]|nr:helix-turn-helix transcriptional regulator [Ktedonobacteraceae bacterium]
MTGKFVVSQNASLHASADELTSPLLLLSSEEAGWEGLVARAYHEPMQFEGVVESGTAMAHIPLVLFTGGAMYMEQRPVNGCWKGRLIRPEDLILSPDGSVPGELRWKGLTPEPTQTFHLHLSKDLLARTAEEVADYDPARLTLVGRSGFQDPLLTQIGFALWRELEQPTPAGKLYAQTAAQMLAVHLLRHYTGAPVPIKEPSQGLTRQQVTRVTDFILAHLSQDLSLEALAQQAGFSSYHFARLFRQTLGESPHQFVLRQRIERAQYLLKETAGSLAHIAGESGFADQSHFTRIFKRHLGLTPRAYRQAYEIRAHLYQDAQE